MTRPGPSHFSHSLFPDSVRLLTRSLDVGVELGVCARVSCCRFPGARSPLRGGGGARLKLQFVLVSERVLLLEERGHKFLKALGGILKT